MATPLMYKSFAFMQFWSRTVCQQGLILTWNNNSKTFSPEKNKRHLFKWLLNISVQSINVFVSIACLFYFLFKDIDVVSLLSDHCEQVLFTALVSLLSALKLLLKYCIYHLPLPSRNIGLYKRTFFGLLPLENSISLAVKLQDILEWSE